MDVESTDPRSSLHLSSIFAHFDFKLRRYGGDSVMRVQNCLESLFLLLNHHVSTSDLHHACAGKVHRK